MADPDEIVRRELEKLGEDAVRLKHAQCQWGMPGTRGHAVVSEWLRKLEEEQASHDPSTQVEWPTGNTLAIIAIITAISSSK